MTIKKQFILLTSIIVTIPILTIIFIFIQNYLSSPRASMIEQYNNLVEEYKYEYTEKDLEIIHRTLERISPDFEFVIFAKDKIIISTFPELKKDDYVSKDVLISIIDTTAKQYIYQYRLINDGKDSESTDFYLFTRLLKNGRKARRMTTPYALLLTFIIGLILICIIIIIRIFNNIFRSINTLEKQTHSIANGNLDVKIDISGEKQTNEITSIASSLEKMRISLLEAQNRKYKFIMGLSHDLRTPVSIIKGYTEAIHDGIITDKEETNKALELINIKTTQLDEMIETLLSYIKLNNIELRNKFVSQSITDFITNFAKSAKITGNVFKRNVNLDINLPYNIQLPFDTQLVNRAFENIFSNAIRYTKDNDSIFISSYINRNSKVIFFSIKDTGSGIKKEDLNNIFELFYRGTSSRREEGLGIGLSVVKNIIETHGWNITVHSKLNEGSDFIITIPFSS